MRNPISIGVLALGVTFGLACGDAARTLLPPDASAQDDAGVPDAGPRFEPARIIEGECLYDPDDPYTPVVAEFDVSGESEETIFGAQAWVCGINESEPADMCRPADGTGAASWTIREGGTIKVKCGSWDPTVNPPTLTVSKRVLLRLP